MGYSRQCIDNKKRTSPVNPDSLTILIADDHPLFRDALKQVISQLYPKASLVEAASVADLQQQVDRQHSIDLLLLDLHMPGALGFSALSWFVGQHPKTPVIMISANSHPQTVRRALDHGAAGFLSKSAEINDMASRFEAGNETELLDDLTVYLRDWLINHIMLEDMEYKPYLSGSDDARRAARDFTALGLWSG